MLHLRLRRFGNRCHHASDEGKVSEVNELNVDHCERDVLITRTIPVYTWYPER